MVRCSIAVASMFGPQGHNSQAALLLIVLQTMVPGKRGNRRVGVGHHLDKQAGAIRIRDETGDAAQSGRSGGYLPVTERRGTAGRLWAGRVRPVAEQFTETARVSHLCSIALKTIKICRGSLAGANLSHQRFRTLSPQGTHQHEGACRSD